MESWSVFYIHLISYKKGKLICQVHVVFAILLVIEVTKAHHDKIKEKIHTCRFKDKGICFWKFSV